MMTRRTREGYKKIAEDNFLSLSEELINDEVIDFAHNIYGELNVISAKYSPESVVDLIPIVINILNRLDATLKVNSDLTNTTQEICEENNYMKQTLHAEKQGRKTDLEESLLYEKITEKEISELRLELEKCSAEKNVLTEKLKSKNAVIDLLTQDISDLTNQLDVYTTNQTNLAVNINNEYFQQSSRPRRNNKKRTLMEQTSSFETPNRFEKLCTGDSPNIPGSIVEVTADIHTEYLKGKRAKVNNKTSTGKLTVLADSHGRGLIHGLQKQMKVFNSMVLSKPGAKLKHVVKGCEKWAQGFSPQDYLVVFGGTNDFGAYEPYQLTIRQGLDELLALDIETNVIIVDVPYRYDLPDLNNNISFINKKIKGTISRYVGRTSFSHLHINNYLTREHYTTHGLHLRKSGKSLVVRLLRDLIRQNSSSTTSVSAVVQSTPEYNGLQVTKTQPAKRPPTLRPQLRQVLTSPDIKQIPYTSPINLNKPAQTHFDTPALHASVTTTSLECRNGLRSPASDYSSVDSSSEISFTLNDLQTFPPLTPNRQQLPQVFSNGDMTDKRSDFLFHAQPVQRVT